ncbi:MAG: hypothetical protein WD055_02090 [Candidatus Dependentiae bacterium]
MKLYAILSLFLCVCTMHGYFTPPAGPQNETIDQAKTRFEQMAVRQINNIDMSTLTENQLHAFKELSQSIFHREIASAGCFSQANRRKYEVMYQKIGEIECCHKRIF